MSLDCLCSAETASSALNIKSQTYVSFAYLHSFLTQGETTLTAVACVTQINVKEGVNGGRSPTTYCSAVTRGLYVSSDCSNAHWQVERSCSVPKAITVGKSHYPPLFTLLLLPPFNPAPGHRASRAELVS